MKKTKENTIEFLTIFFGLFILLVAIYLFQLIIVSSPILQKIFIEPACDRLGYCDWSR